MTARAESFVHDYLLPILCKDTGLREATVAVVSHGIFLNHLWRSVLKLFAQRTVSVAPGLAVGGADGGTALEYLGGWSNTGYLELDIHPVMTAKEPAVSESDITTTTPAATDVLIPLSELRMVVKAVNGKEHLQGLKRTRGVSSGKHDEGQKKIESFFKKSKVG